MPKLLRTDLPDEVWDRLNAEAHAHGQKIGAYLKYLLLRRDARLNGTRTTDSTTQG